jgi:alpha-ketoglutarate-dependent 2,4-dichlorophenoxyacetate dioxygenase
MTLTVRPLHPLFAAELIGADLGEEPRSELVDTVEQAMAQYAVLVIRDQHITDEGHIRFSRAFGPLELPPNLGMPSAKKRLRRELYDASNLDEDGQVLAPDSPRRRYNRGNELFHTDSSFNDLPTKWSLLLAHVLPPEGGNTEFIDLRAVYADLPPEIKRRLDGVVAEHYLWHSRERGGFTAVTDEMKRLIRRCTTRSCAPLRTGARRCTSAPTRPTSSGGPPTTPGHCCRSCSPAPPMHGTSTPTSGATVTS